MPVLVLIISGIVGFGFVFAQQIALGNAARQAARSAVVDGPVCGATGSPGSGIKGQAQTDATTIGLNNAGVTVTVSRVPTAGLPSDPCGSSTNKPCAGSAVNDNLQVRLGYTSTLALPFFQPTFNLTATGMFRCEFS